MEPPIDSLLASSPPNATPRARQFDVLRILGYQRFITAATLIGVSLWTFQTAMSWTILESTGSASAVGLYLMALVLPIPFAALPSGVLTDRVGPARVMVLSLGGIAAIVASAAFLAGTGRLDTLSIMLIGILIGICNGLYIVPSQVTLGRIVERRMIAQAIGLSGATIGLGRLLGGPLGGLALAVGGPAMAFALASIGLTGATLILTSLPRMGPGDAGPVGRLGLIDALRSVRAIPEVLAVVGLGATAAAFVFSHLALIPLVVRDVLRGGPTELGMLTGATGIGVIAAAVTVNRVGRRIGHGRLAVLALGVAALLIAALGFASVPLIAVLIAGLISAATSGFNVAANVLLQTLAPLQLRGRVLAVYGTAYFAILPIGTLLAAAATDGLGVGPVLAALGAFAVAGICLTVAAYPPMVRLAVDDQGRPVTSLEHPRFNFTEPKVPTDQSEGP